MDDCIPCTWQVVITIPRRAGPGSPVPVRLADALRRAESVYARAGLLSVWSGVDG
jgi:hypothetical protein